MPGVAYHGPHVLLTPPEVERIAQALDGLHDDTARSVLAKCSASIAADPKWREPTR